MILMKPVFLRQDGQRRQNSRYYVLFFSNIENNDNYIHFLYTQYYF